MPANGKRPVYRFSHFELNAEHLELRKHGSRVKLQEQPFRLLEALLAQPGTLVTREDLRAKLWPGDTFVDFDHGLNVAAARLRQALGDSARLPRFVESVPRRGYRFIAPVEVVEPVEPPVESNEPSKPVPASPPPQRSRLKLVLVAASVVLAAAAAVWWLQSREHPAVVRSFKFTVAPPDGSGFVELDPVVLSLDGRHMVFPAVDNSGETELWIRPLDEVSSRRIEGTKGAAFPFWSPDSRSIAFFANQKLYRVEISGGLPKIVCNAVDGRGGTWNVDGRIVFAPSLKSPLYQVAAEGGEPKALTSLNAARHEISHRWPFFLPDGRHFLFANRTSPPQNSGIYLGSLTDGRSDLLIPGLSNVTYANGKSGIGYLLYAHDATLVARPFDPRAMKFMGAEFPVADVYNRALLEPLRADFSASDTGVLVYRSRRGADRLTWFDRNGSAPANTSEKQVSISTSHFRRTKAR